MKQNVRPKLKVSGREAFKLVAQYFRKRLLEQVKSVALIISYLVFFQTMVLGIPLADSAMIATGIVLVVLGLTFFMEGLLLGLMPLGEVIGIKLPQKSKLPVILGFAFVLGLGATFAEPAIGVLKAAGQSVTAWDAPLLFLILNKYSGYLVWSVGIGVGVAVVFGMLRFLYNWSLKPFIYVLVLLLTGLSFYAWLDPNLNYLLGLAWDCGGVTTGPVTVPLVLALGIGISRMASGGSGEGASGFGVVTLASLFPIIAVLLIGIFNGPRVPEPMPAADFFSENNRERALKLFEDEDELVAYALKKAPPQTHPVLFGGDEGQMTAFLGRVRGDEKLARRLFGTEQAFLEWAVSRGNDAQRLAVFGSAEEVAKALRDLQPGAVVPFEKTEFLTRNSLSAVQAIIPLSLFMILVLFILLREKLPQADEKILGIAFALFGMAIFNGGIELGLSKIGDQVGSNLPASFTTVEQPDRQTTITGFDESVVQTALDLNGKPRRFFYAFLDNEYRPVAFAAERHDAENRIYNYIPSRGPLFGGREGSLLGLFIVLLFAFVMGYGATLAEPALNALGLTVEEITVGTFRKSLLMQAVAIGVGVGIAAGVAKIIWDLPLFWMLAPPYLLLLFMTRISTEEFVNIAWDSAGVTTGPITVPLVLAMGLGIGARTGVVEGFGILSMASVSPIISVLTVGLVVSMKRRRALKETLQVPEQVEPGEASE